nr:MAG TPA: hypothetical protein [Bacteriophage sp.]
MTFCHKRASKMGLFQPNLMTFCHKPYDILSQRK